MEPEFTEIVNDFPNFKDWYDRIIKEFNFEESQDEYARDLLLEFLQNSQSFKNFNNNTVKLKNLIQKSEIISIFGCGPSLEKVIENIERENALNLLKNHLIISADGAALFLDEIGLKSNIIFTDLDGIPLDKFSHFLNKTDFMIIHAHGDNISKLRYIEDFIKSSQNIIGTTQVEPKSIILNPSGFTDGDRIVFFLNNLLLPHQKLFLIGMDFGEIIGRYSKPDQSRNQRGSLSKVKKLQYAQKLLEWNQRKLKNEMFFVGSNIVSDKFKYLYIYKFVKILKGE